MTRRTSNHDPEEKGLNSDDYSFVRGSIPGATPLKLKDVLDSGKINKKKIMPDHEKSLKNKNMLGDREVNTIRAFKSDIDQVDAYLSEIRKYAFSMGYVERCGRGNKGPRVTDLPDWKSGASGGWLWFLTFSVYFVLCFFSGAYFRSVPQLKYVLQLFYRFQT